MRRAVLALALLLAGCTPVAWQQGLETAGTVVDTAAVVRARQIGLCGTSQPRQIATPEDVLALQDEIEALKTDLATMQGRLTREAIERARRPLPSFPLTNEPLPPIPPLPPPNPPPKPSAAPQ